MCSVTNGPDLVEGQSRNDDVPPDKEGPPKAVRHRLPRERQSHTHHFEIAGYEGYIIVGLYPNGKPGEIFITMAKAGSTIAGLMNSFAQAISIGLQHGVPLKLFCDKFSHTRFEPSGWTSNPEIGFANSIMDYIARWLRHRFVDGPARPVLPNEKLHESAMNGHHHPAE